MLLETSEPQREVKGSEGGRRRSRFLEQYYVVGFIGDVIPSVYYPIYDIPGIIRNA